MTIISFTSDKFSSGTVCIPMVDSMFIHLCFYTFNLFHANSQLFIISR